MLFNSLQFLIFFPIVTLIYFAVPDKVKYIWLLICSYYFYMCWNAKYALLLLFSTLVTYICGLMIERIKGQNYNNRKKKTLKQFVVSCGFTLNLIVLFFYKYFNFALETLAHGIRLFNIELNIPTFDIILPVGISFFTFQALSYIVDVYRDEVYAERNFFRYALFVSFFPQLVAGPIERSKNLLKQLAVPQKFDFESARDGFALMLWGFFLKIVLADRIAIFVDKVYGNYYEFNGWYIIVATILFAVQIYCDFAGYSTIAVGAAKIMGIHLMENFDAPYLSTSVAEFWRKWHISLTSWFKDYLYIPLGGSRKGKLRKYINKLIVFLVSGLWHGANVSFVVWGGLNGLYQIIGEELQPYKKKVLKKINLNEDNKVYRLSQMVITFVLVDFAWIFFRAEGFKSALQIIKQMLTTYNFSILFDGSLFGCGLNRKNFWFMILCIILLFIVDNCKRKGIKIREVMLCKKFPFRCVFWVVSICVILIFGIWGPAYDAANFIYFQF